MFSPVVVVAFFFLTIYGSHAELAARCQSDDAILFEDYPDLASEDTLASELLDVKINNCLESSESSCDIDQSLYDTTYREKCEAVGAKYHVCNYLLYCSVGDINIDFKNVGGCWAQSCGDADLEAHWDETLKALENDLESSGLECTTDATGAANNCCILNPPTAAPTTPLVTADGPAAVSGAFSFAFLGVNLTKMLTYLSLVSSSIMLAFI